MDFAGADGGTRTRTLWRGADFKSAPDPLLLMARAFPLLRKLLLWRIFILAEGFRWLLRDACQVVARWLPPPRERVEMTKVTKRMVDALKPAPDRDQLLWDDEIPGFGVRCRPSGAKSYFLKYRTQGGRQHWLTLGLHGPLTPEQARKTARREKAAIADGGNPSRERQRKRREATIAAVADRYLAEHVATHNKASTAAEARRIVETRIKPKLGAIKITDLTRADIKAWHQAMSATPYEANRALAYCSRMIALAATEWQLREDNPCTGIKRFPE